MYKEGKIGYYNGIEVYCINFDRLTKEMSEVNERVYYAVKQKKGPNYYIVNQGKLIGELDNEGHISIWPAAKRREFVFKHVKEEEVRVLKKEEGQKNWNSNKEYPIEVKEVKDFKEYSKVVDSFFERLKETWKDFEKELDCGRAVG